MKNNKYSDSREKYLAEVCRQMIGPYENEEKIDVAPWDFYHTGMIWPAGEKVKLEDYDEDKEHDVEASDGFMDLANASHQGAIGFTCYVRKGITDASIELSWATYNEEKVDSKLLWRRVPFNRKLKFNILELDQAKPLIEVDNVTFRLKIKEAQDFLTLTFTLVNQKLKSSIYGDGVLYQTKIIFDTEYLIEAPVRNNITNNDPEFWQHELIYRDYVHFATGHGCAVEWDGIKPNSLRTSWMPESVVYKASPEIVDLKNTKSLSMSFLGSNPKSDVIQELSQLPQLYEKWINEQECSIEGILKNFAGDRKAKIKKVAFENIDNCIEQCNRIKEGINLLANNDKLFIAFQLANLAIQKNIELSVIKKGGDFNFEPRWRPFQLAFILLSTPSTVIEDHKDREVMELIWFPTGGGKTEAYLGLTALLIFYRYLIASSVEEAAGTAVITRYTLRLLTIQQFERAALMICAANIIKKQVPELQEYKDFDIGLFVGGGATPNSLQKAHDLLSMGSDEIETTLPLQSCPVCGSPLNTEHQIIKNKQLITWCSSSECLFNSESSPLPLMVIDEQIYNSPPTFLIGTVDKFANMPFTPEMGRLLGRNTKAAPLQLIIQDELHLISDALGTVTALFETAIDEIASINNKVKIVGSTATIRRAEVQVRKLFNRKSMQFPPPCLNVDDSYFYQSNKNDPGRLYVGVHAQGRSPKHTLSRLAANCFQATEYTEEQVRDSFYTLVMYFNSMRELGSSLLLLEDDVPKYLEVMAVDEGINTRKISRFSELTSKLTPIEIPQILDELSVKWPISKDSNKEPIDAVLATNMISVGVDVSRLGAMIVNGQPKNTSEYIQASSRVGRDDGAAGIVFTLYNWTRPRDRSHYEKFHTYHSSFYRHVETSSVTPFASRARDRALHSALIAMVRLKIPEFYPNESAVRILEDSLRQKVRLLMKLICQRVKATEEEEEEDTKLHLENILFDWQEKAERSNSLKWTAINKYDQSNYLIKQKEYGKDPWEMQRSVRDVEGQVKVSMYIQDV